MSRRFKIYLAITGVTAAIVLAFPFVTMLGILFGVVPGLVFGLAPSIFLYSLLWWCTRALVVKAGAAAGLDTEKRLFSRAASLLAIATIAVPALLVPRLFNVPVERAVAALRADDKDLGAPIDWPATVAVISPINYTIRGDELSCDTLCQRLLYNRATSRVVMAELAPPSGRRNGHSPAAFWIEQRDRCPAPPIVKYDIVWPADYKAGRLAPAKTVAARAEAGECLLRGTGRVEDAGLTIAFREVRAGGTRFDGPWSLWLDTVGATRLEITNADGSVLFRRTETTADALVTPLFITVGAGLLTSVTYRGWARAATRQSPLGPHGRDVLPELLGTAVRPPDPPPKVE